MPSTCAACLLVEVILVAVVREPHQQVRHDLDFVQQPGVVQLLEAAVSDATRDAPPSHLKGRGEKGERHDGRFGG